jgi:hypothetical protein
MQIIHLLARLTSGLWTLIHWMWIKGGSKGGTLINKMVTMNFILFVLQKITAAIVVCQAIPKQSTSIN